MLLQISNGAVAFGDDVVLHDINFEIRNTEKIAVVGRNGCGKTTLLKLINGEYELEKEDGEDSFIAMTGQPEIGYLKQIAFDDPMVSLEDEIKKVFAPMRARKAEVERMAQALEHDHSPEMVERYTALEEKFREDGGYYFEKEEDILIRKFGFSDEERKKPLAEFSGGQQTKIAFVKLLLSKPDILLLDEPTNHLDVTTIEWLEAYLKNYPKAVVVVSHDRMFLDNVVDVVYEIEYGTAKRYPGNYTDFMKRKEENFAKQMKDYKAQQKEIERLQQMVDKMKGHPTKVSMARSKQKAIERMDLIEAPNRFDNRTFHANFQPEKETGNDVLSVQDLAIGYDNVLSTVRFELKKGEKLGIIGGNGLGKSTFMKTIVGQIPPLGGGYQYGTNVEIGYFDQQMAMYRSDKTVLQDYWDEFPTMTETQVRSALGAFLLRGDDVYKNVNALSGGEKVRLALCKILKRKPNVLILDEPTNHMDLIGKETLEKMLRDYTGTLIFVSHDRYFIKRVANRLLEFEGGSTHMYEFGYEEYLEKQAAKNQEEASAKTFLGGAISQKGLADAAKEPQKEKNTQARDSYALGKERSRLEKKLQKAEADLAEKEAELEELKKELLNPAYQSSYSKLTEIQNAIDEKEAQILEAMEVWEELSTQLEQL